MVATITLVACAPAIGGSPPGLPPDDQQSARLLGIAGEGFRIRETDHFTIAYDSPYETIRPLIGRLEGTYDAVWRFCKGHDLNVEPLQSRLLVLLYETLEGYTQYRVSCGFANSSAIGFYSTQTNLATFLNTLSRPEVEKVTQRIEELKAELGRLSNGRRSGRAAQARRKSLERVITSVRMQRDAIVEQFNRLTLQHEAAHQMLFNLGVHSRGGNNPLWLVEGLACQFEVPQTDPTGRLRRINQMRLGDFRDAVAVAPRAAACSDAEYQAAMKSQLLVSIHELIGNPEVFTNPGKNTTIRYAQAWGLVFYLSREHRQAFTTYLNKLAARPAGEQVDPTGEIARFEAAFGPAGDRETRKWIDFMLKLRYDPTAAGR